MPQQTANQFGLQAKRFPGRDGGGWTEVWEKPQFGQLWPGGIEGWSCTLAIKITADNNNSSLNKITL